jgi:hypothetical protein
LNGLTQEDKRGKYFESLFKEYLHLSKTHEAIFVKMINGSKIEFQITEYINPYSFRALNISHYNAISNLIIGKTIVLAPLKNNEKYYDVCLIKRTVIDKFDAFFISVTTSDTHPLAKNDDIFFQILRTLCIKNGIFIDKIYVYYLTQNSFAKIIPIKDKKDKYPGLGNILFKTEKVPFQLTENKNPRPMNTPGNKYIHMQDIIDRTIISMNSVDMSVLLKLVIKEIKSEQNESIA